jgi:prepilin-type N-terminal cleavage/methylation domain-containing protein
VQSIHAEKNGFTIVELLIVIVVIGILAALTLVTYKNVSSRAITSSLLSDLAQNQQLLQSVAVQNSDQYPTSQTSASYSGVKSNYNTLTYRWVGGNNYCLQGSNTAIPSTYYVTNTSSTPQTGTCPAVVNTVAGTGTASGYVDAIGSAARFNNLYGITIDSNGNLYVSEFVDNRIRKITPNGTVSTFAGSGLQGLANGAAGSAKFYNPTGLAIDASDNIYVADTGNNVVRKITQAGVVSTVAGTGTAGFSDGAAASAQFNGLRGVAVDAGGNVFVADCLNYRIRKISTSGTVTTFAGSGTRGSVDGPAATAQFAAAMSSIVVDSSGNVFTTTYGAVRKVTPSGTVSTVVGYGGDVQAPSGLGIDKSNNLYISDIFSLSVYKITPSGVETKIAGTGDQAWIDGLTSIAAFSNPNGVTVDPLGNIYVTDLVKVDILLQ